MESSICFHFDGGEKSTPGEDTGSWRDCKRLVKWETTCVLEALWRSIWLWVRFELMAEGRRFNFNLPTCDLAPYFTEKLGVIGRELPQALLPYLPTSKAVFLWWPWSHDSSSRGLGKIEPFSCDAISSRVSL